MLLGNIEVKVGAGWGSEGIIAAALQTQEMSEALLRKQLGRVEDCVLEQVGQTWAMNVIMIQMVPAYYSLFRTALSYPGDAVGPKSYQLLSREHRHLWRLCCPLPEEPTTTLDKILWQINFTWKLCKKSSNEKRKSVYSLAFDKALAKIQGIDSFTLSL